MIILVQGPPCTGKSTLCKRLGEKLGIEHLSKDHVSESMFASGVEGDTGRAANAHLVRAISNLAAKQSLIVETNFSKTNDTAALLDALGTHPMVEVLLNGPKELLLSRFVERWESGARHPLHGDGDRVSDLEAYLESDPQPIGIGEVLRLDASDSTTAVYERAFEFVSARLTSNGLR